jgi:hypothetical protein
MPPAVRGKVAKFREKIAEIMRLAIVNHGKAKRLRRAWEAQTLHPIELNAALEPRQDFEP